MFEFRKRQQPKPVLEIKLFKQGEASGLSFEEWQKTITPSVRFNSPPIYGESLEEIQTEIDKENLIKKKKRILELQKEFTNQLPSQENY